MVGRIRVVIADDQRLIRDLIGLMLHEEETIQIVGEAANGPQTMHVISDLMPDVLLLNSITSNFDPIEFIPPIRRKSPNTKPLMLNTTIDEVMIFKALKAGAKGYISLDSSPSDLIKAIQTVHKGELWVTRNLMARFFDKEAVPDSRPNDKDGMKKEELTQREKEILRCLATGCTNKEIADTLFISDKTVKCHLNSIFKKLNVTRRLQATLFAINKGLA